MSSSTAADVLVQDLAIAGVGLLYDTSLCHVESGKEVMHSLDGSSGLSDEVVITNVIDFMPRMPTQQQFS